MAEDSVLKVGAEFDVSPLIAGTQQAVTAFNNLGTAVQQQAAKFKAAGLSDSETVSVLRNLGYAAKDSAEAVASLGTTSEGVSAQVAALQEQVAALTLQLEKLKNQGSGGFNNMRVAMGQARIEAGALTGSTGMVLGGFARLAAGSQALAPLIEAAFPVFAAFALADVLKLVVSEYHNAIDALAGWDAEARKDYDDIIKKNFDLIVSNVETKNQIRDLNQIGKEGMEKFAAASKDTAANLQNIGVVAGQLQHILESDRAELERINSLGNAFKDAFTPQGDRDIDRIAQLKAEIKSLTGLVDELNKKQREMHDVAEPKNEAEEAAEAIRLSRESREAQIEDAKAIATAQQQAQRQSVEQLKAEGKITADQEAALLKGIEADALATETKYYENRIALARSEGSAHLAEVERLGGEELAAEINIDAKKREIDAKAAEDDRKAYQELAKGLQEDFLRELEKQAELYKQAKIEEAETAIEAGNEQIEIARDNAARLEEIDRSKYELHDENLRTSEAKQIAILNQQYQETVAALTQEADVWRELAKIKVITEEEASKKLQEIWKQEAKAHEQLVNQITKEQLEAAKKQDQSIDQVSKKFAADWVQMTNSVLRGQESIGTALVRMAAQMELQMIDKGIAFVVSKTAEYLLQLLASHVSFIAQLAGIQVAGNAQAAAQTLAAKELQVQILAGQAAAGAFASAMVVVPFPADFAVATAAASEAAAETEAVGSFAVGGVVPGAPGHPVGAIVHAGERVLTPLQNTNFERIANSTTNNGGNIIHRHTTININHQGTNMSDKDISRAVRDALRKGELQGLDV